MGKKLCKQTDELAVKARTKERRYYCSKCQVESPKEKWCCKPKKIKR
jgi:hypothetical protein